MTPNYDISDNDQFSTNVILRGCNLRVSFTSVFVAFVLNDCLTIQAFVSFTHCGKICSSNKLTVTTLLDVPLVELLAFLKQSLFRISVYVLCVFPSFVFCSFV